MAAKEYTESELRRMQQDAVERVREMQSRANLSDSRFNPPPGYISPNFRNWTTDSGTNRRKRLEEAPPSQREPSPPRQEQPVPPPPPVPEIEIPELPQQEYPMPPPPSAPDEAAFEFPEPGPAPPPEPPAAGPIPEPPIPPPEDGNTTIIQDILGGIGLDDDRLLIIGLLFILINAKADTTLILALMYLLI